MFGFYLTKTSLPFNGNFSFDFYERNSSYSTKCELFSL